MFPGVYAIGEYAISELPDALDLSIPDPLSALLATRLRDPVYLVIAEPYNPATGAIETVYLSSRHYWTKSTDTPANQLFVPVLRAPYNIQINMFNGGKLSPSVVPGFGDITLANPTKEYPNRTLDHLFNYSWRNRSIEIYLGEAGTAFSSFGRIFKGQAAGISGNLDTTSIQLRDLQPKFDVDIQQNLYRGTQRDALELTYSMSSSGYLYSDMTGVADYVVQSGDLLTYEVYWFSGTPSNKMIAFDFTCSDATTLRASGVDQNGISAHPTADLSSRATGQWYTRTISLSSFAGKTIQNYDLACEVDGTSIVQGRIRNIKITNTAGTVVNKSIWVSGNSVPAVATHLNSGTNSLTIHSVYEGTSSEAGKPKPLAYGVVRNVEPVLVHANSLVYQVHDRSISAILDVKDKGASLTSAGTVTNVDSWTPVASQYVVDLTRGLIKLGSAPAGQITVDFQGDNTGGYVSSSADIIKRIVTNQVGLTYPDDFDSGSLATVNTANSAVIGYYTGTENQKVADALNAIVQGIGGYWTFDRQSLLKIGILNIPSTPSITLTDIDVAIDGIELLAYPSPTKRHRLAYKKLYTVQNASDLASSLSVDQKSLLSTEYQYVTAEDPTVSIIHQDATNEEIQTLYDNTADAQAEATRRQGIFGRTPYRFKVPLSRGLFTYYIDTDVNLKINRWGLEDGMWFKIMSVIEEVESNNIVLELWGVGDPTAAGDILLLDSSSSTDMLLLDTGSTSDVLLLE